LRVLHFCCGRWRERLICDSDRLPDSSGAGASLVWDNRFVQNLAAESLHAGGRDFDAAGLKNSLDRVKRRAPLA